MITVVGNPDPKETYNLLKKILGYSNSPEFISRRKSAIAYYKNVPVGAVVFSLFDNYVYINAIGVLEEYSSAEIWKALIDYVEKVSREVGAKHIEVIPEENAIDFFKSLGFEQSDAEYVYVKKLE